MSTGELALLDSLRADTRIDCVPRRSDLPPAATDGIECHPRDPLVEAVGVYGFFAVSTTDKTLAAYLDRMAQAEIGTDTGDCSNGVPGDRVWPAYLPDEGADGTGVGETRAGCFFDVNGNANIRVTCYGDVYIGVLGRTNDLAALNAWTWKVAAGESTHRDPPGICARPD